MDKNPGVLRGLEVRVDTVKGVAPQFILSFFHAVEADPENIGGKIQRQRSVGRHRDAQEALPGIADKIMQTIRAVAPQAAAHRLQKR